MHTLSLSHGLSRFVKPFKENDVTVDAATIIKSLGMFDGELMRCPARYAARLSQAFTATDATVTEIEEIIRIPDIENDKYCFTDGVGTLSLEMARDHLVRFEIAEAAKTEEQSTAARLPSTIHGIERNALC